MALGPKELGSWANDPILSTEIRGGYVEKLWVGRDELPLVCVWQRFPKCPDEQELVPTVSPFLTSSDGGWSV